MDTKKDIDGLNESILVICIDQLVTATLRMGHLKVDRH